MKKRTTSFLAIGIAAAILTVLLVSPVVQAAPPFGMLWYEGEQLRTFAPPAAHPHEGRDAIYRVPGTGGVASVAPGDPGYHGGDWAVYDVTWNVPQYPLTSDDAVLAAEAAGHVTIMRNAEADFRCPIQP
ncbi:MAG: hypothetical protein HY340_04025 [Candidatus Kerfeldbacteria bacterium]|nr:hypothetical protein [Candidatus Kerfeldbacteria bacterium]